MASIQKALKKTRLARDVRRRSREAVGVARGFLRELLSDRVRRSPSKPLSIFDVTAVDTHREAPSLSDHLAKIVHKRLSQLEEVKHFETAEDPVEAVHDLRVASRRLRAFVDVFEPW